MNYLITGGAGFIGSNLVDRLLKFSEYNHITVIDNLYTGKFENIPDHPRLQFIQHDVADVGWINRFATETIAHLHGLRIPDVIYNLACPASPKAYQKTPIHTTITSVMGAYHSLLLAQRYNARFIQTSTSEVYGDPEVHPQPESYWGRVNSFGPRACYDEGKRAAEALCYDFQHEFDVDIRVARIFNTYGPNMDANDGRVVSNFIVQALKGEDITIYGDGNQTRSFCYVDDMVSGLLTLAASYIHTPVNLGNPQEFTIKELAEIVLGITNSKSRIVYKPSPIDDPKQRKPDITLANGLGWRPNIGIQAGVYQTTEYFRKVINA
jgi:UDP-glucuronate decarboxylase